VNDGKAEQLFEGIEVAVAVQPGVLTLIGGLQAGRVG
jgi:hypothetical protein